MAEPHQPTKKKDDKRRTIYVRNTLLWNALSRAIELGILYRPGNGALKIIVELKREHVFVRDAVQDLVKDVKAGTDIEPFIGSVL